MLVSPKDAIKRYRKLGYWGDTTIWDLFCANAERNPERVALVDPFNRETFTQGAPRRLTYKELTVEAENLAALFLQTGLKKDDIIVVQLPNTWEFASLYLAAAQLGVVISPVPVQYRQHELDYILDLIDPVAFITCTDFKGFNHAEFASDLVKDRQCIVMTWGKDGVPKGVLDLCAGLGDQIPTKKGFLGRRSKKEASAKTLANYRRKHPVSGDDAHTICWTSGTEGQPKGVPRSHNHWISISYGVFDGSDIREGDHLLNPFPLINMGALGGVFMSWLRSGGRMVLHHPLDLPVFLKQIADEKINYTVVPPALLNMLLKNEAILAQADISSLRSIGSGSAPLSPWMVSGFKGDHGVEIINIFGSNEGVALIGGHNEIPDPEARAVMFPRFGRTDLKWPNGVSERIETKLLDPETDEEILEIGKSGEMVIRGATVFNGYYKGEELYKNSFTKDGFFRTGDLFQIAGEESPPRYYQFVGRSKQLIIRGGMKISPEELDNMLEAHPKLAEAAVAGYPDDVLGERICAIAVAMEGETVTLEDITEYLKECGAAIYKLPERLRLVDALPRNPVGKVMRSELEVIAARDES